MLMTKDYCSFKSVLVGIRSDQSSAHDAEGRVVPPSDWSLLPVGPTASPFVNKALRRSAREVLSERSPATIWGRIDSGR